MCAIRHVRAYTHTHTQTHTHTAGSGLTSPREPWAQTGQKTQSRAVKWSPVRADSSLEDRPPQDPEDRPSREERWGRADRLSSGPREGRRFPSPSAHPSPAGHVRSRCWAHPSDPAGLGGPENVHLQHSCELLLLGLPARSELLSDSTWSTGEPTSWMKTNQGGQNTSENFPCHQAYFSVVTAGGEASSATGLSGNTAPGPPPRAAPRAHFCPLSQSPRLVSSEPETVTADGAAWPQLST